MKKNIYLPKIDAEYKAILALAKYYEKKIESGLESLFPNGNYSISIVITNNLED